MTRGSPSSRLLGLALVLATNACGGACACAPVGPARELPRSAGPPAPAPSGASAPNTAGLSTLTAEEAERARAEWSATRVAIVVLDPQRGAILAQTDDAPERPLVPASTIKPLVVALALDAGAITPEQRFDCGHGAREYPGGTLRDVGPFDSLSTDEVIVTSSNIGTSRIFDALGAERFEAGMARLGLSMPKLEAGSLRAAVVAIGHGTSTTPVGLARAYTVLANEGVDTWSAPQPTRVIGVETARAVRTMMEHSIYAERATGKLAAVPGVRVAGKTGTHGEEAPVVASFVGWLPAEAPRFVILVSIETAKSDAGGGSTAAPVFARVAERALALQ